MNSAERSDQCTRPHPCLRGHYSHFRAADVSLLFFDGHGLQFHRHDRHRRLYRSGRIPVPLFLPGCRLFELSAGACCFLATGPFFTEATLLAAVYVVFLGFSFHGPSRSVGNQVEFGFFVTTFTFLAALLYRGRARPRGVLAVHRTLIGRAWRTVVAAEPSSGCRHLLPVFTGRSAKPAALARIVDRCCTTSGIGETIG